MAKMANGWAARIAAGALVLLLVGFNSWVGANIVDLREQVARMVDLREQVARIETKLDTLMQQP
jgi:hypothetical protein